MTTNGNMEDPYEALNNLLSLAANNLDAAASQIRDLKLAPETNIKKVGESLYNIFQIQHEIYAIRPDLRPDFLDE